MVVALALAAGLAGLVPGSGAGARPAGEFVEVNGVRLHYTDRGAGEPLLLLHGFGSCATEWEPLATNLAKRYRVITPDLRGHGQSTNPSRVFGHPQSAEDMVGLLDKLGITRTSAIGSSSGGMILLHLAARHPERLEKMVVVSATSQFPEAVKAMMRNAAVKTLPPPVAEVYRRCATRGDAQVHELINEFRALGDSTTDMAFDEAALRRISTPTLIVHGDRDEFFPISIPVAMYESIPGSELWIVPQGHHAPMAGASASAFRQVVEGFLAR